ncbi:hypothetical protein N7453_005256 [Penicillium expansum]|nr:hypothetical protein N7453_005256 [Penicillium expansum]
MAVGEFKDLWYRKGLITGLHDLHGHIEVHNWDQINMIIPRKLDSRWGIDRNIAFFIYRQPVESRDECLAFIDDADWLKDKVTCFPLPVDFRI